MSTAIETTNVKPLPRKDVRVEATAARLYGGQVTTASPRLRAVASKSDATSTTVSRCDSATEDGEETGEDMKENMLHSNAARRAKREEENRKRTPRRHFCPNRKLIVRPREREVPRQGRGEQGDDRGSTAAVRCEPLSRKESSRTSLSMASAREVLACSTKECCETLSQRGPERPTQRRECQDSQCTQTPTQLPASPQQPNINRTHTCWRSGGSTAWMSRHTGGSRQDTHGTVPPRRGPWVAQSLRTQHLFFVFPVIFFQFFFLFFPHFPFLSMILIAQLLSHRPWTLPVSLKSSGQTSRCFESILDSFCVFATWYTQPAWRTWKTRTNKRTCKQGELGALRCP